MSYVGLERGNHGNEWRSCSCLQQCSLRKAYEQRVAAGITISRIKVVLYARDMKVYVTAILLSLMLGLTTPLVCPEFPLKSSEFYLEAGISHLVGTKIDAKQALRDLNKSILLNPNNAAAYLWRGNALNSISVMNSSNMKLAVQDYSFAILLNPSYGVAFGNRAGVRQLLGDIPGAISDYSEAIRLNPENTMALCSRGRIKEWHGDKREAEADYKRVLRSFYKNSAEIAPTWENAFKVARF